MSKFRKSILIFGSIILCVAAALITFLSLSAAGLIVSDPIELTFTMEDSFKVYDGTPLTATGFRLTGGELLKGHTADAVVTGEQTDAGFSTSGLDVRIYDKDGYDVTKEYAIRVNRGLLLVEPSSISVKLADVDAVYNGEPIYCGDFEVTAGALAPGHKLLPSVPDPGVIDVDAGLSVDMHPLVFDAVGNEVTQNYRIEYTGGSVQVQKRPITLRPISVTKEYDGTPLAVDSYEIIAGSLVEGHFLRDVMYVDADSETNGAARRTDVGTTNVKIRGCAIYTYVDSKLVNVSKNYLVTGEAATLSVEPRALTVVGKSGSWSYDSQPHTLNADTAPESVAGLLPGQSVSVAYSASLDGTRVESCENPFTVSVTAADGETDVTDNYEIESLAGTLSITKAPVPIRLKSVTQSYGDSFHLDTGRLVLSSGEIPANQLTVKLSNAVNSVRPNAGVYPYTVDWAEDARPSFMDLYALEVEPATITVQPMRLQFTPKTLQKEYDGRTVTLNTAENLAAMIPTDAPQAFTDMLGSYPSRTDVLQLTGSTNIKNAGDYTYTVEWADTAQWADRDNFELSLAAGTFTVTPADLSVTLQDTANTVYTGKAVKVNATKVLQNAPLGVGNELTVADYEVVQPEILDVGAYEYTAALTDNERTRNYRLTVTPGKLNVTPATLTLAYGLNNRITYTYGDAVTPNYADFRLTVDGTPLTGVTVKSATLDVSKRTSGGIIPWTDVQLTDASGRDVTGNFAAPAGGWTVRSIVNARQLAVSIADILLAPGETISEDTLADYLKITVSNFADGDYYNVNEAVSAVTPEYSGDKIIGVRLYEIAILNSAGVEVTEFYEQPTNVYARVIYL